MDERRNVATGGCVERDRGGHGDPQGAGDGWKQIAHEAPPANPAARGVSWTQALTWAASSGVALAVTRLVAQRGAAEAWKAVTGDYPKALEEVA